MIHSGRVKGTRSSAADNVISSGLALWFNADSYPGTGSTWTDSISGVAAGLVNGPAHGRTPPLSFSFDGVDDYMSLGTTNFISTSQAFTVQIWMRHNPRFAPVYFHRMLTLKAAGTTTLGIGYSSVLASGYEGLYITSNTGWARGKTVYHPAPNVWGMLTLTYNGLGAANIANFQMYWDKTLLTFYTDTVTQPAATTDENYIGVRSGADNQQYRGQMSKILLYNRALTQAEISYNWDVTRSPHA